MQHFAVWYMAVGDKIFYSWSYRHTIDIIWTDINALVCVTLCVFVLAQKPDKSSYRAGIISGTAERNDCISFRILQEYDNLRNGTGEHTVIGRNGTLILTLCLTLL